MGSPFEGRPQRRDETGRLWVYIFGRWTPVAEPDDGAAGVPARLPDRPPPLIGRAEVESVDAMDRGEDAE